MMMNKTEYRPMEPNDPPRLGAWAVTVIVGGFVLLFALLYYLIPPVKTGGNPIEPQSGFEVEDAPCNCETVLPKDSLRAAPVYYHDIPVDTVDYRHINNIHV